MASPLLASNPGVSFAKHPSTSNSPIPSVVFPLLLSTTHLVGAINVRDLPEISLKGQNQIVSEETSNHPYPTSLHKGEGASNLSSGMAATGVSLNGAITLDASASQSIAMQSVTSNLIIQGAGQSPPNPCYNKICQPDPTLGVGPKHVFEMVNKVGIIYFKNGTLSKSAFLLTSFFNLTASGGDPQIIYDKLSGRWFASTIDPTHNRVQFAVSTSNDPTLPWKIYYASTASGVFPDQPFIGASDDKFVISANDECCGSLGAQYWIFNKAELVAGANTIDFATNIPSSSVVSLHPVQHLNSSSGLFYMVTVGFGGTGTITATLFTVSGVPPNLPTVTPNSFNIAQMTTPPPADQPGGVPLNTDDGRVLSAVWESNTLWFSKNNGCTINTFPLSCLHLTMLSTTTSPQCTTPPCVLQDFDYGAPGLFLFYPAVSLFDGQLVVVYGESSGSVDPSLYVTGRGANDAPGTLQSPLTIGVGTTYDSERCAQPCSAAYGDYFGAATDPTPTNRSLFWVAGEFYNNASSGLHPWSTVISQVSSLSVPSCSASANPTSGKTSVIVHFSASCAGGAPPYSYSWQFNDANDPGASSTLQNPTHTYYCLGVCSVIFYPTLAVTDILQQRVTPSVPAITVYCRNSCPQNPQPSNTSPSTQLFSLTYLVAIPSNVGQPSFYSFVIAIGSFLTVTIEPVLPSRFRRLAAKLVKCS